MKYCVPEYGAHCNWVARHAGAGSHPEEPILRVDRAELPVGVGSEPRDVVAHNSDLDLGIVGFVWLFLARFVNIGVILAIFCFILAQEVHLVARQLGTHHCQVGLATGRGESGRDVLLHTVRPRDPCDQHVLG